MATHMLAKVPRRTRRGALRCARHRCGNTFLGLKAAEQQIQRSNTMRSNIIVGEFLYDMLFECLIESQTKFAWKPNMMPLVDSFGLALAAPNLAQFDFDTKPSRKITCPTWCSTTWFIKNHGPSLWSSDNHLRRDGLMQRFSSSDLILPSNTSTSALVACCSGHECAKSSLQ
jgi:hypothetical protein